MNDSLSYNLTVYKIFYRKNYKKGIKMTKKILITICASLLFVACGAKTIEKTSPCACYDIVIKRG